MELVSHMYLPSHFNQKQNSLFLGWTSPAHGKHSHNSLAQLGLLFSVHCFLFPISSLMSYFLLRVGDARVTLAPARFTFSTSGILWSSTGRKRGASNKRGGAEVRKQKEICAPKPQKSLSLVEYQAVHFLEHSLTVFQIWSIASSLWLCLLDVSAHFKFIFAPPLSLNYKYLVRQCTLPTPH